tara:strand:- start:95 stop:781 length:687 start_codon:yes stop_codon:yes gene_type:complete
MSNARNIASGAKFVDTAGDTMTGALTVGGTVTVNPDADSSLLIKDGGTNALMMTAAAGDELYIGANNEYAFRIKNDGTKDVAFDNGGRVTMPSQPSVSGRAIRPEYGAGYATTGVNLYFNDMTHNTGNHFNNSTGVFTCPVAGRYFCYGSFLIDDNHSAATLARFSFFRNNSEFFISYNHDKYGSSYGGSHTTGGIFSCAANDTITCKATHGAFHVGGESSFSITYLG